MGLFSRDYNKPGPGVSKDTPRKTGAARFFELLFRDFVDFVKLSLLMSLIAVPSFAAYMLGIFPYMLGGFEIIVIFLLLSLPLAFPIGGALVACYFNITRFMRDDPSYVWFDFKRKFKENYRQAALTGIICTAFIYMQILLWFQLYFQLVNGVYTGGLLWIVLAVFSFLLFFMVTPYIFLHYAYVDMKTIQIIKNSFLMSFAFLPRSFMGAVCGGVIWVLFALFMPGSLMILPFIPLFLVSFSMFLSLSWVWPPFNKHFEIEETLRKRKDEREEKDAPESDRASTGVFNDKSGTQ